MGLAFDQNSWWGVWIIEFLFIYFSLIIGFILLNHLYGFLPAILGSISWITILGFIIGGGNLAEEYGILFQFIILYLFFQSEYGKNNFKTGYLLIGVVTALLFLLNPRFIGISSAILIYLVGTKIFYKNEVSSLRKIKYFITGFIALMIPLCLIFFIQGNFFDFIDQFIYYNTFRSSTGLFTKFLAFKHLLSAISAFNLVIIILVSCIFAVIYIAQTKENNIFKKILIILLINLPIELFLISNIGTYKHYYMSLLPIISIFIGFFVYSIISYFSSFTNSKYHELLTILGKILAIVLIFGLCITPYVFILTFTQFSDCLKIITTNESTNNATYNGVGITYSKANTNDLFSLEIPSLEPRKYYFIKHKNIHQAIQFISENTTKEDYVLIFGAESVINFMTQRKSPTRYVYQYPLYMQGYDNTKKDQEFLSDLTKNPPKLIIITNNPLTPFEKFSAIIENYTLVANDEDWKIYQKILQ